MLTLSQHKEQDARTLANIKSLFGCEIVTMKWFLRLV